LGEVGCFLFQFLTSRCCSNLIGCQTLNLKIQFSTTAQVPKRRVLLEMQLGWDGFASSKRR
jgi:hypothetical protein